MKLNRFAILFGVLMLICAGLASAQSENTPVPATVAPLVPVLTPLPPQTAVPSPAPEQTGCAIPVGFAPHVVRPDDTLPTLMARRGGIWTAPIIAALNCLDDTDTLPVGALIFLPPETVDTEATPPCVVERLGVYTGDLERLPCPANPPLIRLIVWQPFENGLMLWFSDTHQIYALFEDGSGFLFNDTFVEGQEESLLSAPDGLFAPERGFRVVWDALGGVNSGLGWGLARETGYDALTQPAGRASYTLYLQLPERLIAVTAHPDLEGELFWIEVERDAES